MTRTITPNNAASANSRESGFTLVEIMISAIIFALCALGALLVVKRSYELGQVARHRDEARAVINSFTDAFLRGSLSNEDFFRVTNGVATGEGLTWTVRKKDGTLDTEIVGTAAGLSVPLGDAESSIITGTVTRTVDEVVETDGTVDDTNSADSGAGRILVGQFQVKFTVAGQEYTQTVTVGRATQ